MMMGCLSDYCRKAYDFNLDGFVNARDYQLLIDHWDQWLHCYNSGVCPLHPMTMLLELLNCWAACT